MLKNVSKMQKLVLIALFTALIVVGAYIKIPLPAVPFTLQTMFTTMSGILLGPVYGGLTVLLYIFMGLIGLPVFTQGGGFSYVLIPSFGFTVGMLFGAIVAGIVVERLIVKSRDGRQLTAGRKVGYYVLACLLNTVIIYVIGLLYYYVISRFYIGDSPTAHTMFVSMFLLTLPGDMAKCAVAILLSYKLNPILSRGRTVVTGDEAEGMINRLSSEEIALESAVEKEGECEMSRAEESAYSDIKTALGYKESCDDGKNQSI